MLTLAHKNFSTLLELAQYRASDESGTAQLSAFSYLDDGEQVSGMLSYAELDRRARAIAVHLQAVTAPGDRVLLVYPPSLEYIVAFFACVYAGVIAVPALPPANTKTLPRLQLIAQDAEPRIALTLDSIATRMGQWRADGEAGKLGELNWLASDALPASAAEWQAPSLTPDDIAFLQYTSGSTGTPKGVMVSHGNIIANCRLLHATFEMLPSHTLVSWLPPHHDMGLIGKILYPVFAGCHCIQLPPAAFLLRPYRWLKLMSDYRARGTAAPNFAYELCVSKITDEQKATLDLSALEFALNGAEPIRPGTVERFAKAFGVCGFRAEASTPVYGLAEATLLVTAQKKRVQDQLPPTLEVSRSGLYAHQVSPASAPADAIELVSTGRTSDTGHSVLIADPDTLAAQADGAVGEIWVCGPSVAQGYWKREEESARSFGAQPAGVQGTARYLRTGDLGFVQGGELFVTGRIKEMMIFNGRNVYPQDIETNIEGLDPAFRSSGCAVFSFEENATSQLVIIQEIESRKTPVLDGLAERLRAELSEHHHIFDIAAIVLVKAGHIPRTSSGKIQRLRCRDLFSKDEFSPVWAWRADARSIATTEQAAVIAPRTASERQLVLIWQLLFDLETISVTADFFSLGGHSLLATQIMSQIRSECGVELPLRALFEAPSIEALARQLDLALAQQSASTLPALIPVARAGLAPLSFSQQRLWFLHQFDPGSAHYNIPAAIRLHGDFNAAVFTRAINEVLRRHEALRTTFTLTDGTPQQRIAAQLLLPLAQDDLRHLPDAEREERTRQLVQVEANTAFDLETGPLLRLRLLKLRDDEHVLLLTVHHIVADGWSMSVLGGEISALYGAFLQDQPSPLPELAIQYADYAHWQRQWLQGEVLERQLAYWRTKLQGAPALLTLPTDRPRPALPNYQGASFAFTIPASTVAQLHQLGKTAQASLFMTLSAAFKVMLARHSGQSDISIGTFIANRGQASVEALIGFFLNTLVLRSELDLDLPFSTLLQQVRATTLDAYAHQDAPFEQVVEAAQAARHAGHTPLFQVMLNLHNTPVTQINLAGARGQLMPVDYINSRFDLALEIEEQGELLEATFEYDSTLFNAATIARMAGHFTGLLAAIGADASCQAACLPMLADVERAQLVTEWNRSEHDFPLDQTYARLFAAQAASRPDQVAAICCGEQLTYRELDQRANRIAHALVKAGAGTDTVVALLGERGLPLLTMMVAVLKAGAAFLPMEVNHPQDRLRQILETSRAPMVLVTQSCTGLLDALLSAPLTTLVADALWLDGDASDPLCAGSPGDLAYVISTSGSTGKPKSAMVEQRGMLNNMYGKVPTIGFGDTDRLAQTASAAFDICIWQFLAAPLVGATVHILPDDVAHDPLRLMQAVADDGLTVLEIVPSMMRSLLDLCPPGVTLSTLRWILPTGEALPLKLAQDWFARFPALPLMNVYGPAECSDDVAYHAILASPPDHSAIPIGRPTPNNQLFILDTRQQLLPVGVEGEICVAGVGVGRGYLHAPELTQAVFIAHPFASEGRFYRTGDLGRYRADGVIEFVGRLDHQVKIRGFRIELGEIESTLAAMPQLRDVVVVAREDHAGDQRLVAYLVGDATEDNVPAIRAELLRTLPDYMVPAHFMFLERLPLTPNGKLDRRALPAPDMSRGAADYVAPRTPVETTLATIWAEVLKLDQVGVTDNFFQLGGHSLLATQLVSKLRKAFAVELPLRALFEAPTIEALAVRISQEDPATQAPAMVAVARDGAPALSFAQQRLWFLDQFETGSAFYNIPAAVRLTGTLDVAALTATVNEVVKRHEALRTRFGSVDGAPLQAIAATLALDLPLLDLSDLPHAEREARAAWLIQDEAQAPFDLATGPLIRARLLRLQDNEHIALFTMHHIVSDGWSMGVLVQEVAALYAAFVQSQPSPLPPLAIQYADFAHWQRQWLSGDVLAKQLDYWTGQLAGAPTLLALPTDRPRPAVQSFRGAQLPFTVSTATTTALQALGQQQQATLFMVLTAAFNVLLARYSGQSDICIGTPIANRNRAETEALIGFFVNTLVLRAEVDTARPFTELLQQVRSNALAAYAHQDVPFEQLVEAVKPERHLSHSPLFQVVLALQNAPMSALELPGLLLETVQANSATAKFDLTLNVTEQEGKLACVFEYSTDLFDAATIARMAAHFQRLLDAVVAAPSTPSGQLAMLDAAERFQLLTEWNATEREYAHASTIAQLFEAQAARHPDLVAASCAGQQLSYAELNTRANQVAHHLRSLGVGPDRVVGICVERSLDMVVGMLGIVKAGAAYLPMDPAYPQERLAYMLESAQPAAVLTQSALLATFPEHAMPTICLDSDQHILAQHAGDNPAALALPGNLAIVLYTSGSTGRPKGVSLSHQAVMRLVSNPEYMDLRAGDKMAQTASSAFDAITFELWAALVHGCQLCIIAKDVILSPQALAATVREQEIDVLFLTTALFNHVASECPQEFARLRHILFGGEAADPRAVDAMLRAGAPGRLLHFYGPAESTTFATWHQVQPVNAQALTIPLGRPVANTQIYLLDAAGNPVALGVAGELCIGGVGLARGYMNRPDLTAEKFVANPFSHVPGSRMYQTGDLARYLPNGDLEYLGRIDDQVKIRGLRIELGEIAAALAALPEWRDAIVIAREDTPGDKRLAAYLVPQQPSDNLQDLVPGIRAALLRTLPDYMVPAHFMFLDQLPLTANGKLDRRALPVPDAARSVIDYVAPRTPTETSLAAIWAELLKVEQVGVHDNFFQLGGHSLMATQMVSKVRAAFNTDVQVRALFESPTIETLAHHVDAALAEAARVKAEQKSAITARLQSSLDSMTDEQIIAMAMEKRRLKAAQQKKDTANE